MTRTNETNKSNNKLKVLFGTIFIAAWFIYQISPLFKTFVFDAYQLIFTGLMITGMIIISTIKTEKSERAAIQRINLPRV